jgi:hypothetical protein
MARVHEITPLFHSSRQWSSMRDVISERRGIDGDRAAEAPAAGTQTAPHRPSQTEAANALAETIPAPAVAFAEGSSTVGSR